MNIGKPRHNIDVSSEYFSLASEDEKAALILKDAGKYRQAIYFTVQAMEKYIRAKIFSYINPKNDTFREMNRNHSVDEAVALFIDIVSPEIRVKEQVREQLERYVVGDIKFNHLHNNLRYPFYSEKYNSFSCLDVTSADAELFIQKLNFLKKFLKDIDLIR
jgi:HEPN domain-containing protein